MPLSQGKRREGEGGEQLVALVLVLVLFAYWYSRSRYGNDTPIVVCEMIESKRRIQAFNRSRYDFTGPCEKDHQPHLSLEPVHRKHRTTDTDSATWPRVREPSTPAATHSVVIASHQITSQHYSHHSITLAASP